MVLKSIPVTSWVGDSGARFPGIIQGVWQDAVAEGAATAQRRASRNAEKKDVSSPKSQRVSCKQTDVVASLDWTGASRATALI
jgi:hypothetical protein